ncbi:tape measure protein [uncultured Anoxybacillus sp.]|uniref:tape measure protein n=1 Tax=uncultured Anoxybacillus sp. TaxID=263860 RepID=UPI002602318F|nr:tape measure protein [uncultured Anoxybacillus sp.]
MAEVGALRVTLGLDSADFSRNITDINRKLRAIESEFKVVSVSAGQFDNSLDQLKATSDVLTRKLEAQQAKVQELKRRYDESAATKGKDAAETEKLLVAYNKALAAMRQTESQLEQTKQAIQSQSTAWGRLKSRLNEVGQQFQEVGSQIQEATAGLGATLTGIGASMAAAVGSVTKFGIEFNARMEQSRIAWETLLKSTEKATEMQQNLQKLAETSPFDYEGLDKTAKMMLAMGWNAENLLPDIKAIGDAVSAVGGGTEALENVGLAFAQMNAKGKISAEEMNQLAENGIPAWQLLAQETGKSVQELMKMSENGKLFANETIPLIMRGMQEKFGGSMEKASNTFTGQLERLKEVMNKTFGTVSMPLFEALKNILPEIADKLQSVGNWFSNLSEPMQKIITATAIIVPAFTLLTGGILLAIGAIGNAMQGFGALASVLASAGGMAGVFSSAIAVITGPVGIAIGAIAGLVAIGVVLYKNWDEIKAFLSEAWEGIKATAVAVWDGLKTYFTRISNIYKTIFSTMWEGIKTVVITVWQGLKTAATAIFEGIKVYFTTVLDIYKTIFSTVWNTIKTTVVGVWEGLKTTAMTIFNAIASFLSNVWNGIWEGIKNTARNWASSFAEIGKDLLRGIWNGMSSMADWLWDKVRSMLSGLTDKIKNFFGIRSPSRLFAEYGGYLSQGLAIGITDGAKLAENSVVDMAKRVAKAGQQIGNIALPSIKPAAIQHVVETNVVGNVTSAASGTGPTIIIENMVVRNDEDIYRISRELYSISQSSRKARGMR